MFKLNWANVKSAFIYGVLAMLGGALLAVVNAIMDAGTIFGLDWKVILDKGAMAALGAFVASLSIIKNLLTNDKGKFLGAIEVIPKTKY